MAMGTLAFMPYVGFFTNIIKLYIFRWLDRRKATKEGFNGVTAKRTVQSYLQLYSGPEVLLQIQYSTALTLVFVTFTYGLALPALFPITLVGLINLYIIDRLQFAYFYRRPPMIGNDLNNTGLSIFMFAPMFMMAFGYWQLGNREQFFNEIPEITERSEHYDPKHALIDYDLGPNYTMILLAFFVLFGFFSIWTKIA